MTHRQPQEVDEVAKAFYERHLARLRTYYAANRETMKERMTSRYHQMKEDPEKYQEYLAKKRERYHAKKAAAK